MLSTCAGSHTLVGPKGASATTIGTSAGASTEGWARRIRAVQLSRQAYSKALRLDPTQGALGLP